MKILIDTALLIAIFHILVLMVYGVKELWESMDDLLFVSTTFIEKISIILISITLFVTGLIAGYFLIQWLFLLIIKQ